MLKLFRVLSHQRFKVPLQTQIHMPYSYKTLMMQDKNFHKEVSYLAELTIDNIISDRTFKEIQSISLTEQIKQSIESHRKIKSFSKEAADIILQFFQTGVKYEEKIFKQARHKSQLFAFQKKKYFHKINKKNQEYKIRFFPTTLVSSQVFRSIMGSSEDFQLLIGHKGISKSISVQLYWHLSNIICSYRCRTDHDTVQDLQILDQVPKIVYWNINQNETPKIVRSKILMQLFQLGDNLESSNYLLITQGIDPTEYYKQRGIPVILFVDQLNLFTNFSRQLTKNRQVIQEIQQKKKKGQQLAADEVRKLKSNISFSIANQTKYMNIWESYFLLLKKNIWNRIEFFSSVNIENNILKQINLTDQGDQAPVKINRFRYEEFLSTEKALYEFIDYFLLEVKEKIKSPLFQLPHYKKLETQKQLRDKLFLKFKDQKQKLYLTPFMISSILLREAQSSISDERQSFDKIASSVNDQNTMIKQTSDIMIKLFQKLVNQSLSDFKVRAQQFIKKDSLTLDQKFQILAAFFCLNSKKTSQQSIQQQPTYSEELKFKYKLDIGHLLSANTLDHMKIMLDPTKPKEQIKTQKIESYLDKNIFKYEDGKIISYFKYEDLELFFRPLYDGTIDLILSYQEEHINYLRNNAPDGRLFEKLFIQTFSREIFNVEFPNEKQKFKKFCPRLFGFTDIFEPQKKLNNLQNILQNSKIQLQELKKPKKSQQQIKILQQKLKQLQQNYKKQQQKLKKQRKLKKPQEQLKKSQQQLKKLSKQLKESQQQLNKQLQKLKMSEQQLKKQIQKLSNEQQKLQKQIKYLKEYEHKQSQTAQTQYKFNFLKSFQKSFEYIQQQKSQNKQWQNFQTFIFVPVGCNSQHTKFLDPKNSKKVELRNISGNNPNIDVIFMRFSKNPNRIELHACDLTIDQKQAKVVKKLKAFLNNFKLFNDKEQTSVTIKNVKYEIEMHYFVLSAFDRKTDSRQKDKVQQYEFQNNLSNPKNSSNPKDQTKNQGSQTKDQKDQSKGEKDENANISDLQLVKQLKKNKTFLKSTRSIFMGEGSMNLSRLGKPADHKSLWFFDRLIKDVKKYTQKKEEKNQEVETNK